jgi:PadR family transcriptional regulator, regulatory protein PadR
VVDQYYVESLGVDPEDPGLSENNRKARFYSITKSGRKQLTRESENWERISKVIGRVLQLAARR